MEDSSLVCRIKSKQTTFSDHTGRTENITFLHFSWLSPLFSAKTFKSREKKGRKIFFRSKKRPITQIFFHIATEFFGANSQGFMMLKPAFCGSRSLDPGSIARVWIFWWRRKDGQMEEKEKFLFHPRNSSMPHFVNRDRKTMIKVKIWMTENRAVSLQILLCLLEYIE